MEVVVETEAGAGASGYSVTGGGEKGIFVKDVLKDSPAAKHLSLQQGTCNDTLLKGPNITGRNSKATQKEYYCKNPKK